MARQPFLPAYTGALYMVGATALEQKSEFARLIGLCMGVWSYVDNEMGTLFGLLLGVQSQAILEVFLTLRRATNQIAALKACAKHRLTDERALAFEALLIVYNSLETQRNDLAHGCFGLINGVDDALLWIRIEHHVHFIADHIAQEYRGSHREDQHELLKENMFVYKLKDLERLHAEMKDLWMAAFHFNAMLRYPTSPGAAQHLKLICDSPQIQQHMSRLRAKRQDTPK
jgi:hypothetical protein